MGEPVDPPVHAHPVWVGSPPKGSPSAPTRCSARHTQQRGSASASILCSARLGNFCWPVDPAPLKSRTVGQVKKAVAGFLTF